MSAQSLSALAFADEVRLATAARRREIAALPYVEAREAVAALLESPTGHDERQPLVRLLCAIPSVGRYKSRLWLEDLAIGLRDSQTGKPRQVRHLTERQRRVLAAVVRGAV